MKMQSCLGVCTVEGAAGGFEGQHIALDEQGSRGGGDMQAGYHSVPAKVVSVTLHLEGDLSAWLAGSAVLHWSIVTPVICHACRWRCCCLL